LKSLAHGLHERVDGACRDALDVRLLHDRNEGLLGRAAGLEKGGEIRAAAELGNLQVDGAGARLPAAVAVAVPAIEAVGAALAVLCAAGVADFEIHKLLRDGGEQFANDIAPGPLFEKVGECDTGLGHRGSPGAGGCVQ